MLNYYSQLFTFLLSLPVYPEDVGDTRKPEQLMLIAHSIIDVAWESL